METIAHLIYERRIAREIWHLACLQFTQSLSPGTDLLLFIQNIVNDNKGESPCNLEWFIGWRIWKMRNKLMFDNSREHIVHVIKAAIMDRELRKKAMLHDEPVTQSPCITHPQSINDILPPESLLNCIADASWKSPTEEAGIGWSLLSRQGTLICQGSSAIAPTYSALEADAMANFLAVQHLHRLRSEVQNVAILGDNPQLYMSLEHQHLAKNQSIAYNEASIVVQDILSLSKQSNFSFKHVPRNFVHHVDQLAKRAKSCKQHYVISWPYT